MKLQKMLVLMTLVALVATACGSSDDGGSAGGDTSQKLEAGDFDSNFQGADAYPVIVSSELTVGQNRFLLAILDSNDAPISSPDVTVDVSFYDLGRDELEPAEEKELDFIWTVKAQNRGLYVADVDFDEAGKWGAEVNIEGDGLDEQLRTSFEVSKTGTTPAIGAPAPSVDTPTGDEVADLKKISTDPHPDPSFYRKSVKQALADHDPFVLVFATPKFCTSAVCGPTLDQVKDLSGGYPDVTFIHSEIYEGLKPTGDPTEAVLKWGLPSEPWVFVVGSNGKVAAKFEGSFAPEELKDVLDDLG